MTNTRRRWLRFGGAVVTTLATATLLTPLGSPASAIVNTKSGSFRSECDYSHTLFDDPIVFPGESGASHVHDFFGNTTTDADSTYDSLRAGETTCDRSGDTAAYWAPAVLQNGEPTRPGKAAVYYRAAQKDSATIQPFPADLRMIAGDAANTDFDNSVATWSCEPLDLGDPERGCPAGTKLRLSLPFPDCWDGENLDSADHKAHMAYAESAGGSRVCPASHPVAVPLLELRITYSDVVGDDWSLASGSPASAHADFINSWDQNALTTLVNTCVKSGLGLADGTVC